MQNKSSHRQARPILALTRTKTSSNVSRVIICGPACLWNPPVASVIIVGFSGAETHDEKTKVGITRTDCVSLACIAYERSQVWHNRSDITFKGQGRLRCR